jgi:hypothetical protein
MNYLGYQKLRGLTVIRSLSKLGKPFFSSIGKVTFASGLFGKIQSEYCPGGAGNANDPFESGEKDVSFSSN